MAQRPLPRYFLSRVDAQSAGNAVQPPAHVVDCFSVNNRHLNAQEWIVATDSLGSLQALPDGNRGDLPAQVQTELSWQEIAGFQKRQLEASEFFLFYIQLLEQITEAPGLNDPVYLYGTLYGPYPAATPAQGIEGQLTVTRADLLAGLADSAAYAFRYANSGADQESPRRCFHLMLPADREEEIRQGRGIVLAYPLLPPELILNDVANEQFASRLLYDTLSALKADIAEEQANHPLRNVTLPVPSRPQLEQQLQTEGYEIKSNTAVKKTKSDGGAKGLIASVFGALLNDRLELPHEAGTDEFLEIAQLALKALPGWPTARSVALKNLVRLAPLLPAQLRSASSPPPSLVKTPSAGTASTIRLSTPQIKHPASDQPPGWMQDFMAAHRKGAESQSRLTSSFASPAEPKESEWMKDFDADPFSTSKQTEQSNEQNSSIVPRANSASRSAGRTARKPAARPSSTSDEQLDRADWMEDFE
ncbi:MAG: hypothetical protein ABI977_15515 [Acidobacteriota bacterium]